MPEADQDNVFFPTLSRMLSPNVSPLEYHGTISATPQGSMFLDKLDKFCFKTSCLEINQFSLDSRAYGHKTGLYNREMYIRKINNFNVFIDLQYVFITCYDLSGY